MADNKRTRSRKRRKAVPFRQLLKFPQVKGKVIDRVELSLSADDCSIEIRFDDKTALNFDMEQEPGIKVTPDFADWKTGNWKSIKRWRPVHSKSF